MHCLTAGRYLAAHLEQGTRLLPEQADRYRGLTAGRYRAGLTARLYPLLTSSKAQGLNALASCLGAAVSGVAVASHGRVLPKEVSLLVSIITWRISLWVSMISQQPA